MIGATGDLEFPGADWTASLDHQTAPFGALDPDVEGVELDLLDSPLGASLLDFSDESDEDFSALAAFL